MERHIGRFTGISADLILRSEASSRHQFDLRLTYSSTSCGHDSPPFCGLLSATGHNGRQFSRWLGCSSDWESPGTLVGRSIECPSAGFSLRPGSPGRFGLRCRNKNTHATRRRTSSSGKHMIIAWPLMELHHDSLHLQQYIEGLTHHCRAYNRG
ncbi:hypothetical protein SISNIDRAFT_459619 [Sistotremastrum niveocremeum HHB9708]|uniref:Uncharacterized protein n=1 Tax=Sistotremastrum niveocremeum HHB9708 TaxID=1314777 RepID=A0A164PC48_9AGAM|nr:hypothetical protein SISNIDRAFT_459619 [Sistotremastrum niveocremeum HHB9708]